MPDQPTLYPLRFAPIFQYRLWGGRHFETLLAAPLPGDGPVGEAWILSDRDDHPSKVANGPLEGKTITELIAIAPEAVLGKFGRRYKRFPLLLKFLDAREMLSVQVHPSDAQPELLPPGESGKTEAWIVLEADPASKIFAGLQPGTTADDLRRLNRSTSERHLASFHPNPGDGVFIPAGTVHALGGGVVVFEVQENSDVTFRLYDWDRVDAQTGKARDLHVEQALRCIDPSQGPIRPVTPEVETKSPALREALFDCSHFKLWRISGTQRFKVGAVDEPRVVVCVSGAGELRSGTTDYPVGQGDVYLLPTASGECQFQPGGEAIVLEIALPSEHAPGAIA
ncbi:MAG: type I phosphomannose isomerase catalytic subunit [Fimbriimonadaceae bacterium]